ncbi:MAG: hypothetical protein M3436_07730 [Pseudomonadota bacterium]|nr:hypothetical protein [Pseudomonadota bacterium]
MDPVTQFQLVAAWVVLTIVTVVTVFFCVRVAYLAIKKDLFFDITRKHFPAVVGLPIACLAALFIVLISDNLFGPLEFEAPGFKFKGASGPGGLLDYCV